MVFILLLFFTGEADGSVRNMHLTIIFFVK